MKAAEPREQQTAGPAPDFNIVNELLNIKSWRQVIAKIAKETPNN